MDDTGPTLAGVPVELYLFVATLAGVAIFHRHVMRIALVGATTIALYKIGWSPFHTGAGVAGFVAHLQAEASILTNLLLLLLGFALLADHFDKSEVAAVLPRYLPDDWRGPLALLWMVFILSAFLDNIAAAMIGGTIAARVFRGRVHIGYLAAIVAASNAGGAGSVIGDTTTTMMWIAGIRVVEVLEAAIAALVAMSIFATIGARQQHALQAIQKDASADARVDPVRLVIVGAILAAAVTTNVIVNLNFEALAGSFPFLGAAVWAAVLLFTPVRRPEWSLLPGASRGAIFLVALVLCASMMPVSELPAASWQTALGLGFVSAVFDNIPLTALALEQGGYDWGFLAYAVGFGGSMIWFGSSAGVALSNTFSEARSVAQWLRHGWHVAIAYVVGFFVMLAIIGFHPGSAPRTMAAPPHATPTYPAPGAVTAPQSAHR